MLDLNVVPEWNIEKCLIAAGRNLHIMLIQQIEFRDGTQGLVLRRGRAPAPQPQGTNLYYQLLVTQHKPSERSLIIMQWNAEVVGKKKTELQHRLRKEGEDRYYMYPGVTPALGSTFLWPKLPSIQIWHGEEKERWCADPCEDRHPSNRKVISTEWEAKVLQVEVIPKNPWTDSELLFPTKETTFSWLPPIERW